MSNKRLSVNLALIKAKTLARNGSPDEAMKLYQEVLNRFPGNKRAIEGVKSLELAKSNRGQSALNTTLSQEQIDGLIALYNQGRNQEGCSPASRRRRPWDRSHAQFYLSRRGAARPSSAVAARVERAQRYRYQRGLSGQPQSLTQSPGFH